MAKHTIGWLLDQTDRAALLARLQPSCPDVVAHHVTLQSATEQPLPSKTSGEIVGEVDDGEGLQALVIAVLAARGWHPVDPIPIRLISAELP